ncbi:carbohydrate binding family 9 domain-containing protein [Archangium violaceum]|uniref:DUF5916 domain-containing protein n=1 Tax=Archangium violaceum TaxID=83451 RepID=UPI0019513B11|nr:DUF5916 domain-containing protein [Archangium violaceum]QRO01825.1 carbohydrate binding family 9 domain-containing protein [Archangium violaceum]
MKKSAWWARMVGLVVGLARPALAAEEPAAVFQATRAEGSLAVDGRLDEPAWATAPVFSSFTQSFPTPGTAPSEKTEVRLVYDDRNLYVGITAHDSQPGSIHRGIGRRDAIPASDVVRVMVDSLRDRTTGYVFAINAGGTLEDGRITDDVNISTDWDAVWEGSSAVTETGWTAELRLPLRLLRFPEVPEQLWGFHVRREIARTHEQLDSVVIPREANALVSRFTELRDMKGLHHGGQLTLTPYLASRLTSQSRLVDPSVDVGLDFQANLTSDLSLTGTINPDFGQVEADRLLVNLGTSELFFPEKRPFFLEGLDLFQPVGSADGRSAQSLFYSRRIGLTTPLLGAVKLTGTVREGVQIGFLDAVVMGSVDPTRAQAIAEGKDPDSLPLDRRYQFHPERPFHFAPNSSLPAEVSAPTNFLAGVVRTELAEGARVGAMVTSVNPLTARCPTGVPAGDPSCTPRGGQGVAADFSFRSRSGAYALLGQVDGSRVSGGPSEGVLLRDGTRLRSGDMGFGTWLKGGKLGGEPWRLTLSYQHASPKLDLTAAGYQPVQNEQEAKAHVEYGYSSGWGPFAELWTGVLASGRWSTDGRGIGLNQSTVLTADGVLPDLSSFYFELGLERGRLDLREIDGAGIAFQRPSFVFGIFQFETDPTKPLSFNFSGYLDRTRDEALTQGQVGYDVTVGLTWRPLPRLQTEFTTGYNATQDGPRWVGDDGQGRILFAQLLPRFLTLTLRQLVVITPRLTLQAYAQLLTGYGHYGPFYSAEAPGGGILRFSDLQMASGDVDDPSFHTSALNVNLVARWEYRLGSTLFLVYSRAQEELPPPPGAVISRSLTPRTLLSGPSSDTVMLKASYAW